MPFLSKTGIALSAEIAIFPGSIRRSLDVVRASDGLDAVKRMETNY